MYDLYSLIGSDYHKVLGLVLFRFPFLLGFILARIPSTTRPGLPSSDERNQFHVPQSPC